MIRKRFNKDYVKGFIAALKMVVEEFENLEQQEVINKSLKKRIK